MAIANDITSALGRPDTQVENWQLASSETWEPGSRIGPYRLKRRLGKGGMGVVWLADQLQPLQREVALKVMAVEGRDALAETWFEIERQALAQLSHPCVAQIFDAGRLPDGALYFAMEYVPGLPLDEFQAQHRLDWRALAALFVQICTGVQHAHQRGLIHRDLKPLNVLVRLLDGGPAPKIIDFGIAVSALTGVAAPFRVDRVIGTPAYMSLEQRSPGPQGIDARCDIYALGVMLGEALSRAGGEPVARDGIDVSVVLDAVRLELGHPAFDPSRDSGPVRARLRNCPRELLAIALKAMAVDREQRYESAAAMAEDLGRWLERRPVRAVGNARMYVLRCLVRRNRVASLAAALIALAVLAGSAMAVYGMTKARAAQALAEQRRDDAERLIQFMLGDFADKLRPIGRLDLLDSIGQQALAYLGAQHAGGDAVNALSRARALRTLGEVQSTRQQFDDARATLELASKLLGPHVGERRAASGDVWFEAGQIAFYRGLVSFRQNELDDADRHWSEYLRLADQLATDPAELARANQERAFALSNLGTLADARNRVEEALDYFLRAADLRREMLRSGKFEEAVALSNTLSWISSLQFASGRSREAWLSAGDALALIVAERERDPQNASARRLEINLRFLYAQMALALARPAIAVSEFERALLLAREEVANDPTQPRRQAMMIRIALHRARLASISPEDARSAYVLGSDALRELPEAALDASPRTELSVLNALAQAAHPESPPDAVANLRQAFSKCRSELADARSKNTEFIKLLELCVEVAGTLNTQANALDAAAVAELQAHLSSVPESRRSGLRVLMIRSMLLGMQPGTEALRAPVDDAIRQLRALVSEVESSAVPQG